MDQGLKERLIGAAVLVALGVWLIPWVLDGSPEPSESRIATLQLPVPEEPVPMRKQTIRLDDQDDPPGSATADALAEPPADEPAAVDYEGQDPAPAVVAAATETPAAHAHAPMPAEQPAVKPAEPKPAAPKPTQSKPPEPKPTQAATPPPAPTPARPSSSSAVQSGWLVQLGSFSEEENARRLAQRVAPFGYKAELSNHRASGRTMYRVRVGPLESRERADAAASALSAHGFVAQVVAAD